MKFKLILIVSLCLIWGCSDLVDDDKIILINLTQEEFSSIVNDIITELTEDEIQDVISEFLLIRKTSPETRGSQVKISVTNRRIIGEDSQQVITRSGNNGTASYIADVLVHNEDRSDLVIVSTDSRAPRILMYLENYDASPYSSEFGMLKAISEKQHLLYIRRIEENREMFRDQTIEKICKSLDIPVNQYDFRKINNKIEVGGIPTTRSLYHTGSETVPPRVKSLMGPFSSIRLYPQTSKHYLPSVNAIYDYDHDDWRYLKYIVSGGNYHPNLNSQILAAVDVLGITEAEFVLKTAIGAWDRLVKWNVIKSCFNGGGGTEGYDELAGVIRFIYDSSSMKPYYPTGERICDGISAENSKFLNDFIYHLLSFRHSTYFDWNVLKASLNDIKPALLTGSITKQNIWDDNQPRITIDYALCVDGYVVCDRGSGTLGQTDSYIHTRVLSRFSYSGLWVYVPEDFNSMNLNWGDEYDFHISDLSQMQMTTHLIDHGGWHGSKWDREGDDRDPKPDPGVGERWD